MSAASQTPIADARKIERHWGEAVSGVAMDITLDRDVYTVGEDMPLHVALQNMNSPLPIYADGQQWDRCSIVRVTIRDNADGLIVPGYGTPGCSGHGHAMAPYGKGVIVPMELVLESEGRLPKYAGDFTVTVTWPTWTGPPAACEMCAAPRELYVTASASKRFRLIRPGRPNDPPEVPEGVMTADVAQRFENVDTPLGMKTALRDKVSGMEWLHMNLMSSWSYQSVKADMGPGRRLQGWRYATPEEVHELFVHFFNTRDGVSQDAALALQFQRNLGGIPAIVDLHPPGEAGKVSLYGSISVAVDNTVFISPTLQGWTKEGNYSTHYLIRQSPVRR